MDVNLLCHAAGLRFPLITLLAMSLFYPPLCTLSPSSILKISSSPQAVTREVRDGREKVRHRQIGIPSHPSRQLRSANLVESYSIASPFTTLFSQMVIPRLLAFSQGWGLIDLPLRATFHPPTHCHAETCHFPQASTFSFPTHF
jgi:hypothetical protein